MHVKKEKSKNQMKKKRRIQTLHFPASEWKYSSTSYAWRMGRKNRFFLMIDYLLCSQDERILTSFFCFNNAKTEFCDLFLQ